MGTAAQNGGRPALVTCGGRSGARWEVDAAAVVVLGGAGRRFLSPLLLPGRREGDTLGCAQAAVQSSLPLLWGFPMRRTPQREPS